MQYFCGFPHNKHKLILINNLEKTVKECFFQDCTVLFFTIKQIKLKHL